MCSSDLVERVLDWAIALFMYGSGAWLSYALVRFVVTRPKASADMVVGKVPAVEAASAGSISIEVIEEPVPLPLLPPSIVPSPTPPPIVCEPVNWKKWKVGELRQASITSVCGVRTTPIGSKRKLKKADLIAQYEQNLKRMTYEGETVAVQNERIA